MARTATKSFNMIEKLRSIIGKKEKEVEHEEKIIEVDGSTVFDVSNDKCLLCKKSLPQKKYEYHSGYVCTKISNLYCEDCFKNVISKFYVPYLPVEKAKDEESEVKS